MATSLSKLPESVRDAINKLPTSHKDLVQKLCSEELGQSHLFEAWSDATPKMQRQCAEQLEDLDKAYTDGGLAGYIKNAKGLLENSRKGVNPLEGWEPSVPEGGLFELGSKEYAETEAIGMEALGSVGFVLVAGGLGERLGYSSIKVRHM
jgi:UDP-sugar pyrophosphorylase